MDPELLEILVCPETKEPVHLAEPELLERVNREIEAGNVRDRAESLVTEPLVEALVPEGRRVLYPVRDGIPVMLIDEAIPLEGLT